MNNKIKLLLQKCEKDPVFFIQNFIKIKDSQTGDILPFKLWDFQKDYIKSFKSKHNPDGYRFHLVLKSRQLGMSTTTLALILHKAIFQKNAKIVIACKKQNDASKMLTDEIFFMIDQLPAFLRPSEKERNKTRIHFASSNSWIQAVSASPGALRQYQATHVVFDEFAFYNEIRADLDTEMFRAALPSFQKDGFCTIISTPNGLGNMYADYVSKALNHELPKEWWFNSLSWKLRTERLYNAAGEFDDGESFKLSVLALPNGKRIWAAEYDCQLLASGSPVFTIDALRLLTQPQNPNPRLKYIIGADVGGGSGGDYSVAQVLDQYGNQVFTYRDNNINPKDFGNRLYDLARQYNNAIIAVERNNMGISTIDQLENKHYKNLYRAEDGKIGFLTTEKSKPQIIFDLDAMIVSNTISLSDKRTVEELQMYQHLTSNTSSSKMSAPAGKHDDCVMSLAIAAHLLNNNHFSNIRRTSNQMI